MKKVIKSKADLLHFLKSVNANALPNVKAQAKYAEIAEVAESVKDKHGRSTEAREAAKIADKLRRQLLALATDPAKLAPKKKAGGGRTAPGHRLGQHAPRCTRACRPARAAHPRDARQPSLALFLPATGRAIRSTSY